MENYFNYFTEVEECYQRCRGAGILLTPLDWALIESWKEAGIPLDAVRRGVERTFEKYERKRRHKFLKVNGLGYCTQQVMLAAAEARQNEVEGGGEPAARRRQEAPPLSAGELKKYLQQCTAALEQAADTAGQNNAAAAALGEAATGLREIARPYENSPAEDPVDGSEDLERSLTAVEEKLTASLTATASVSLLASLQEQVDRGIAPFRSTMSTPQIDLLRRQFLRRQLFEYYGIPRLSLFFLRP